MATLDVPVISDPDMSERGDSQLVKEEASHATGSRLGDDAERGSNSSKDEDVVRTVRGFKVCTAAEKHPPITRD
jgi:hypothetical protein